MIPELLVMTLNISMRDSERRRREKPLYDSEEGRNALRKTDGRAGNHRAGEREPGAMPCGEGLGTVGGSRESFLGGRGRAWAVVGGTHLGLIDEQHHVGKSVQGHVDRQLHRA